MAGKIDKSKKSYVYSGNPKSYWEIAARKNIKWIPKDQKESEFNKMKRLERQNHLKEMEERIRSERAQAKKFYKP